MNTPEVPATPIRQDTSRYRTIVLAVLVFAIGAVVVVKMTAKEKPTTVGKTGSDVPSQYPPGPPKDTSAITLLSERPPETEAEYRKKYGEPTKLLYVTSERRYYSYWIGGERMYWQGPAELWYSGDPN